MRKWNDIKTGISNLLFYFKVIWYDRWWDYGFVYKLLDKKLEQMEDHWGRDTHYVGDNCTAGRIKVLRKRLASLEEDQSKLQISYYVKKSISLEEYETKQKELIERSWGMLGKNIHRFWD